MKKVLFTALVIFAAQTVSAETIFACLTSNGKLIHLDHNASRDLLTYSFGKSLENPEIRLQSKVSSATGGYRRHYGGVGITAVALSKGNYTYSIEDLTNDEGKRKAGVSVLKNGKEITFVRCKGNIYSNMESVASEVIDTI